VNRPVIDLSEVRRVRAEEEQRAAAYAAKRPDKSRARQSPPCAPQPWTHDMHIAYSSKPTI
jgi:hypothetical protein